MAEAAAAFEAKKVAVAAQANSTDIVTRAGKCIVSLLEATFWMDGGGGTASRIANGDGRLRNDATGHRGKESPSTLPTSDEGRSGDVMSIKSLQELLLRRAVELCHENPLQSAMLDEEQRRAEAVLMAIHEVLTLGKPIRIRRNHLTNESIHVLFLRPFPASRSRGVQSTWESRGVHFHFRRRPNQNTIAAAWSKCA